MLILTKEAASEKEIQTAFWRHPHPPPAAPPCHGACGALSALRQPARTARSAAQRDFRWCWTGAAGWGRVEPLGWLQGEGRGTGSCGRRGGQLQTGFQTREV